MFEFFLSREKKEIIKEKKEIEKQRKRFLPLIIKGKKKERW